MPGIVARYLGAIVAHDWAVVGECIADDIVRVGPNGDQFDGRADYLAYISETMPMLEGYSMDLQRVTYVDGERAFAELSETVTVNGKPMLTPEVLVFEFDHRRQIAGVEIVIQTLRR